jgi:hypothetical protein
LGAQRCDAIWRGTPVFAAPINPDAAPHGVCARPNGARPHAAIEPARARHAKLAPGRACGWACFAALGGRLAYRSHQASAGAFVGAAGPPSARQSTPWGAASRFISENKLGLSRDVKQRRLVARVNYPARAVCPIVRAPDLSIR